MPPAETRVERALRAWLRDGAGDDAPLLLAVSGGLDSIVLLDALARVAPGRVAGVATFDHGTGEAARRAAAHVAREAAARGLPLVTGAAPAEPGVAGEAAW
ncbi:MAG TPA: ATP-binding protein, partial [Gemmatimonadaceae bacterium]